MNALTDEEYRSVMELRGLFGYNELAQFTITQYVRAGG